MSRFLKWSLVLVGTVLVAMFVATMLMVIYPGSFKLTAPLLCPDDRPDAFVVRYNVQTDDGTGTNFTMFCMDDRGQFVEVGTWEPLLYLFLFIAAGMVAAVLLMGVLGAVRRIGSGGAEPTGPPPTPDPFTDQPGPIS